MRNMLLITVVFSASTSVHGADPWGAPPSGGFGHPWDAPAPSPQSYPYERSGTPGTSRVSPLDIFRPSGGMSSQGFSDPKFRYRGANRGPDPKAPPPASDINLSHLTGSWRGSAGERVEIRGNQARIWGGNQQSCYCIFMIYGNRMIAYSPDTDVVKKFEYSGGLDEFLLRDDSGGVMSFVRVR